VELDFLQVEKLWAPPWRSMPALPAPPAPSRTGVRSVACSPAPWPGPPGRRSPGRI